TMVNPCAVKGLDVFLGLAHAMPELQFAAVPTWGASEEELAQLRGARNVTLLEPVDDIAGILAQTQTMLVPSLWAEARSRMVMEAMLRGIPVLASDVGGLREAKLGVPYLLPVQPITRYQAAMDANMVPIPVVPPQDIGPWVAGLRRLTQEEAHWKQLAKESHAAALDYLRRLTVDPFEAYLKQLMAQPKKVAVEKAQPAALSADKKKLLALRLKQRAAGASLQSRWFPRCDAEDRRLRLFCFPHAGAGAVAYRAWGSTLPGIAVCPTLLPGREDRGSEAFLESMPELIHALHQAIRPFHGPFAFFGHSMGAGIAFELARELRRSGGPMPVKLIVSGARAPQYRVNRQPGPEPDDERLIGEIRALQGLPDELLPLALPVLRADTRLYRNYTYQPEQPLAIPIFAYGGTEDPNVSREHLESWSAQTSVAFVRREFPGGHFYLRSDEQGFLRTLWQDLQPGARYFQPGAQHIQPGTTGDS
ncbi:MAG: thioesterase domain-containing protein, partial [Acidobacteriota bacterium]|nr:thioesterase domain-containing protein [Acidobacteriota bacterium]